MKDSSTTSSNRVLAALWRYRVQVVMCAVTGALAGIALGWRVQPLHQSDATLMIETEGASAAQAGAVAAAATALLQEVALRGRLAEVLGSPTTMQTEVLTLDPRRVQIVVTSEQSDQLPQAAKHAASSVLELALRERRAAPARTEDVLPGAVPSAPSNAIDDGLRNARLAMDAYLTAQFAETHQAATGAESRSNVEASQRQRAAAVADRIFQSGVEVGRMQTRVDRQVKSALDAPPVRTMAPWFTLPLRMRDATPARLVRARPVRRYALAGLLVGVGISMVVAAVRGRPSVA